MATPNSAEEVQSIVRRAARDKMQLAVRGGGHSQGGQCLTDGGLVVHTNKLNRVQPLDRELVRAQGGAQWGQVVDALRGTRQLPPVLADVAEVTVGGTLSAGGFGSASHRYGLQLGQVQQLEVITGTGERVRCSRTGNANLFDAVRGGQGQFGIITEAWVRLRKAGERIRQYELRYRDFDRFESDFEQIVDHDRFDHFRVETRVHAREIILSAGAEYDDHHEDAAALEGLGHDKIVSIQDTAEVGRAGMVPKQVYDWNKHHPWRDWIMPWDTLRILLTQPWLDRRWVLGAPFSWIGMYPIRTTEIDAPFFMHPKGERAISYSIFALLHDYGKASLLAGRLKEIDRSLVELGGKSYLSGGVGYRPGEWKEHYGENFEMGIGWKREFDPKGVFGGEGMPFGDSPRASRPVK